MALSVRIAGVKPVRDYTLTVSFVNGTVLAVDLRDFVHRLKGLRPLCDPAVFARAGVGEYGLSLVWPGNLDVGADQLYEMALEQKGEPKRGFWPWVSRGELPTLLGVIYMPKMSLNTTTTVVNYNAQSTAPKVPLMEEILRALEDTLDEANKLYAHAGAIANKLLGEVDQTHSSEETPEPDGMAPKARERLRLVQFRLARAIEQVRRLEAL